MFSYVRKAHVCRKATFWAMDGGAAIHHVKREQRRDFLFAFAAGKKRAQPNQKFPYLCGETEARNRSTKISQIWSGDHAVCFCAHLSRTRTHSAFPVCQGEEQLISPQIR